MNRILVGAVAAASLTSSVFAADLGARAFTKAPVMIESPVTNWSGFYVGGNAGYGWGSNTTDAHFVPPGAFNLRDESLGGHSNGFIGGAQIGYNFQWGRTVLGLETDIQGSRISSSASVGPLINPVVSAPTPGTSITTDQKISWFGTARARLGFSVTPDLLLFGSAGAAYGGVKAAGDGVNRPDFGLHSLGTLDQTRVGWTAGAGAEWSFMRNWSAKIEYLYLDLGEVTEFGRCNCGPPPDGINYTWRFKENTVRAGVNYHF